MMNSTAKNVITLTIITVIAGALLGYVYDLTKGPIADAKEQSRQEAYKKVFNEASTFEDMDSKSEDDWVTQLSEAGLENDSIDNILCAKDAGGSLLGYVILVTSHEGYGGDINISMGIANDGTVKGVEILSISETPGLGMNADTDEFKSRFADKNVASFSYTKTGAKADYEIDALSGATITTRAMTNAVNAGLVAFKTIGGSEE